MDCRQNLVESGEYYMLRSKLWRKINPLVDGMICIDCAERRLGRRLTPDDFTAAPINVIQALRSPKLAERVYANEWQFILFKPDAERLASHFTGDHAKHCSQCAAYANYQSTSR